MNESLRLPSAAQTEALLRETLRECKGDGARLVTWSETVLSERPLHRVVRYDLLTQAGELQCWVGKFYDREETAQRVAGVLRALAESDYAVRSQAGVPHVIAYLGRYRLLLLTYEPGTPVLSLLATQSAVVLEAIGRALAALHTTSIVLSQPVGSTDSIADIRRRVTEMSERRLDVAPALRRILARLEATMPSPPMEPALLHGDFGPAQLLWHDRRLVVLDFDKCLNGDPALDLGNLLAQLRRRTFVDPASGPSYETARSGVLAAYERYAPAPPDFPLRVNWYEQVVLLRKADFLSRQTTSDHRSLVTQLLHFLDQELGAS